MLGNIAPIIFCAILFAILLTLLLVKIKIKKLGDSFAKKFGAKSLSTICIIVLCALFVGNLLAVVNINHHSYRNFDNGNYNLTACVSEIYQSGGKTSVLLKDVQHDDKAYSFNIQTSFDSTFSDIEVGDVIEFECYLYKTSLIANGSINTYVLKNNLHYNAYITEESIQVVDTKTYVVDKLKDNIKTVLFNNMSNQNAGFAFATLCGDKTLLSDLYYQTFKNAGLAHILAVSGLHVGFLVSAVLFVLKLLKIKRKVSFYVLAVVLFIYCMLCGFAPSILRASIMSLCLCIGMVMGERNDTLSNISLAGVIILILQPLYLCDVGFLLSFASVFGILFLQKPISKMFCKIKMPKFLAEIFAVSISATLGTIPIIFSYFGEISLISILSNFVVLPLFSVMFVVLLIASVLNLIFPIPFFINIAEFFVNIVVQCSSIFAKCAMLKTFSFDVISSIIYYLIIFFCSPFVMISTKSKCILFYAFYMLMSPVIATINSEKYFTKDTISVVGGVYDAMFVATKSNTTIMINVGADEYECKNLLIMLKTNKVKHLDYLFLYSYKEKFQSNVANVINQIDIDNIIVVGDFDNSAKIGLAKYVPTSCNLIFTSKAYYNSYDFYIKGLVINNYIKGVNIILKDYNFLLIFSEITKMQLQEYKTYFGMYDAIVAEKICEQYMSLDFKKFVCHRLSNTIYGETYVAPNELWTF